MHDEENRDVKHELINGSIYPMAGASANHERISGNLYRKLADHIENTPYEPFGSDMKIKVGTNFFYPDVLVDCHFDESTPFTQKHPLSLLKYYQNQPAKKTVPLNALLILISLLYKNMY